MKKRSDCSKKRGGVENIENIFHTLGIVEACVHFTRELLEGFMEKLNSLFASKEK